MALKLGLIAIGEVQAVVQSVDVDYRVGEFTTATVKLIFTNVGLNPLSLDFSKLFKSPGVAKAIQEEVTNQQRKYNFDES